MYNLIAIAYFMIVLGALSALGCSSTTKDEKHPCSTAEACYEIKSSLQAPCGWSPDHDQAQRIDGMGDIDGDRADNFYSLYNFHESRNIIGILEITMEGPGGARKVDQRPVRVLALPKQSPKISGGRPDGIDAAGPTRSLGCEWVRTEQSVTRYGFQVLNPCFEDDPSCPPMPELGKPSDRKPVEDDLARCETACRSGSEPDCFTYEVKSSGALNSAFYDFYRDIVIHQLPVFTELRPLITAINGVTGKSCKSRLLTIAADGSASAFGDYCSGYIDTGAPQVALIELPHLLAGKVVRSVQSGGRFGTIAFAEGSSPTISHFGKISDERPSTIEDLSAARIDPNSILLSGSKKFCAKIEYLGG